MGKAFSEEERIMVQEKLRRIGLKLFSKKGIKGVSIREVTKEAGIAQGGFYTFYTDKTDFITDLMELRIQEKMIILKEQSEASVENPIGYIINAFFEEGMHLKENKAFDNMASGTIEMFLHTDASVRIRLRKHYVNYMTFMVKLWQENGYHVEMCEDGFAATLRAAGIMISNASFIGEEHFEKIYRGFCESAIPTFLKVSKSTFVSGKYLKKSVV